MLKHGGGISRSVGENLRADERQRWSEIRFNFCKSDNDKLDIRIKTIFLSNLDITIALEQTLHFNFGLLEGQEVLLLMSIVSRTAET